MTSQSRTNISLVNIVSSSISSTDAHTAEHATLRTEPPEPYTTVVGILTTTDASLGPVTIYKTIVATPSTPFASTVRGSLATSKTSDKQPSHSSKLAVAVSVPLSVIGIVIIVALGLIFLRKRALRKQKNLGRHFDLPSDVEVHDYIYPEVKSYLPLAPNMVYRNSSK